MRLTLHVPQTVLARAPAVFKAGRRASAVATKAPAASAARRASARSAAPALRVAASAARSARVVCAATAGKTTIVDAAIADPTFSVLVEAVVKVRWQAGMRPLTRLVGNLSAGAPREYPRSHARARGSK